MNNVRIADLIRENKAEEIVEAIEEGAFFDMQTFTKSLIDLVVSGTVDKEVAANASTNRHDFLVALERSLKQQAADVMAGRRRGEPARAERARDPRAADRPAARGMKRFALAAALVLAGDGGNRPRGRLRDRPRRL